MTGSFIEDDLSAVLSTADFAVEAVHASGKIRGIFENKDVQVDDGNGGVVIQKVLSFETKSSAGIVSGDNLVIAGTTYVARIPEDDGTGMVTWHLERP